MEKPSVEDMLRVAKLQRQNLSKLAEKIKADASEMRLYSHELECLGDHFDTVEANAKRYREVEVKENELQKRTKIFEAEKKEAGDLQKLVEECTVELRSKKNQLAARLDTLHRTKGELESKEKQLGQVKAEIARRCSEGRKVQTHNTEMEEEINRKKKELTLILHKIEESGKQLKTVDEQLENRQRLMEIRSIELVSKEELESVEESIKQLIVDFELKKKELDLKSNEMVDVQKLIEEKTNELGAIHKKHDSIKLLIQERTEELVAKEKRHEEILEAICKSSSELEDKEDELDLLKNIISEEKNPSSKRDQVESSRNAHRELQKKQVNTALIKPEQYSPEVPINETSHQNEAEFEVVNEETLIHDDLSASLLQHEVSNVLTAIPNPAEFVLDLVKEEICASHQREELSLQNSVVENLVLLLEELTKLQLLNEPQLQLKATQVATLWKEKIRIEAPRSSPEVLAFLMYIVAYGLRNLMNQDETALLASSIAHYKEAPTLFHSLDLNHKIPELVVDLVSKRKHIPAARLICLFKLKDFSPIELLQEEIINLRRSTTVKRESQSQGDDEVGDRLRAILEVVADYKLEIDLPGDLLVNLIRPTNWSVNLSVRLMGPVYELTLSPLYKILFKLGSEDNASLVNGGRLKPIRHLFACEWKYMKERFNLEFIKLQTRLEIVVEEDNSNWKARMTCLIEPFLGIFVDCVSEPLKEQIGYVFCHKQKLQELETKLEEVKGAETRIKNLVDIAKGKGEQIHEDVQIWLLVHVVMCIEVTELLIKEVMEKQTAGCFFRYCLHITSRHKLGKCLVEQSKALADLYEKSNTFPTISYVPLPNEIWVPSTHQKDFVEFESRTQTFENIMVALGRSDISTVGVFGMGGVGKTTTVMEASKRSKELNLFDKVLFATVSSMPDIKKIQGDLADMLGLEFHDQGERGRAIKLHDRLKQEKRLLVVLDDIWFDLDLDKVGIPHGDSHRGCKFLLTSRRKQILENYMNAQMTLEVNILEDKEAWTLFKKVAGNRVEDPDLKDTANKIAKKCAGLPISIVTIAKALKGKGVQRWKNALMELERNLIGSTTDIPNDPYLSIKLSYDNLPGDDMKSVFLLCGYMGGYHIIDLVKYGVGLGFFQSFYSMEDSRNRVQSLVCSLEDCGLLLRRPKHDQFSIHDVVRDVAISIKTKDTEIIVMSPNVGPKVLPNVKTLKNCTAITLFDVHIEVLPDGLNCPKLHFLHIFNKNSSLKIPENFFSLMVELRVVDLTNMIIESLPSSLLNVSNLRTLCLDHSILKDISGIGKLKSLEVLSFLWSKIQQLPEEIGELINLKILDLDHCSDLEVIHPGIISKLTRLEELYMNDSFKNWEYEGVSETERRNANLAELKHLPNLTTFEAHIPDVLLIPKDLLTEKLVRFHVFVGKEWEWDEGHGYLKMLKLKHDQKDVVLDNVVLKLLKEAEELYLDEYKGMENVFCRLDLENFCHLKHLHVQNNSEMEYLVDSSVKIPDSGSESLGGFPLMESLSLFNTVKLKEIFKDKCRFLAFRILRTVKVEKCNLLKVLFPLYIAKNNLTLLEEISVMDCKKISNIFAEESVGEIHEVSVDRKDLQIRSLTLKNLPELVSLCSEDSTESEPPLFSEKIEFPGLESLELESLCIKKIWTDSSFSSQNLGKIIINRCDVLEYVLSSSMVSRLVQLKQLEISNCKKINKIVITEGETTTLFFPKLVILKMDNLQKLTSFFSGDHVEFPILEHLQITKCPQMKELISVPSSNTSLVTTLETNEVETDGFYCGNTSQFNGKVEMMLSWIEMARLWPYQSLKTDLSVEWICSLILENCNNMVYLVPSYVTLTQLLRLEIRYCSNMESILQPGYGNCAVKFPKLKNLKLEDLASLSRIGDEDHGDFPVLEKIDIRNCPNMQCSVSNSAITCGKINKDLM